MVFIIVHKIIFKRKLIFDFDDAIYLHSFLKTKILTQLADTVIVGSHELFDWAKKYNKEVYLIPTSISDENFVENQKDFSVTSKKFTIGWVGNGSAHYNNLKILKEVLLSLKRNHKKYVFLLISSSNSEKVYSLFKDIQGIEVKFINKLEPGLVPEVIKTFDVGVMPLTNDEWSSGKCALKAIEYMACSVPTVASSVGENKYLIEDGVNGFLATDSTEWTNKINLLAHDKNLMEKIGRAGRKTVEKNYTFKVNIPKMIKILESLS